MLWSRNFPHYDCFQASLCLQNQAVTVNAMLLIVSARHINRQTFSSLFYFNTCWCFFFHCHRWQGKTLANQAEEEGDVSDEDEGAETNRRRDKPRKARLCSRLSRLITLKRSGASKWPLIRDKRERSISCNGGINRRGYRHPPGPRAEPPRIP